MTDGQKAAIDSMSYYSLLQKWRFAATGDPLLQGDVGDYFSKVMRKRESELAPGEKVAISKELGWG